LEEAALVEISEEASMEVTMEELQVESLEDQAILA